MYILVDSELESDSTRGRFRLGPGVGVVGGVGESCVVEIGVVDLLRL
jgi:hypothetical protein